MSSETAAETPRVRSNGGPSGLALPTRDLAGATAVLTRRVEDNAALARDLRARGARVIELPCVTIAPPDDPSELAAAARDLSPDDVLVITSRAGADAVATARPGREIPCPVAAVGEATASHAAALGMRVVFTPSHADGRTLGRELPLPKGMVVLARSDIADPELPDILRSRGGSVRDVVAYRTIPGTAADPAEALSAFESGNATVVVASPSAVDALCSLDAAALRRASFIAIGPRTAERVRELLHIEPIVAAAPDHASISRAIPLPAREVSA